MRIMYAALLLLSLVLSFSFLQSTTAASFCESKCKARCAKASVWDRCYKYCGICCIQCKCVPDGTYGNKDQCACYRDMKNNKDKPKCP